MIRIGNYLIIVFLMGTVATAGFGPETTPGPQLLRDGFALAGVDGKLVRSDSNDVWFFELNQDVNDYRAVVKAGTRLQLLPSSTLEKIVADAKTRTKPAYRLWNAEITKYKGSNFIFPRYFLPLREPKETRQKTETGERKTEDGKEETGGERSRVEGVLRKESLGPPSNRGQDARDTLELAIDEPNDILAVPPEIIERLKAQRERPATTSLRQIVDSNEVPAEKTSTEAPSYTRGADSVFVDGTAFLVEQADGRLAFVPDALGRNVQRRVLRLLPCEVLELTERTQAAEIEPLRFKIAGILTTYKDEQYLLLQKAVRTYSHGNFGK
ncbi:MAG: hypothetical protein JXM79_05075 [Sedimentisphaerales bacterium]|nr:hypothetical protein [Sedimentisphaerales bacterium]